MTKRIEKAIQSEFPDAKIEEVIKSGKEKQIVFSTKGMLLNIQYNPRAKTQTILDACHAEIAKRKDHD